MFINAVSHYVPEIRIGNSYFEKLTGLSAEEIYKKSGITERRKAGKGENTNTMALAAVQRLTEKLPYPAEETDLIVGATYTPYDTVATLAHNIQKKFGIKGARVVSISSACSSFVNAVEIVQGYFASGKASRAIVAVSEHNTAYNDESNVYSGFLWGDGAAAVAISKERISANDLCILDVNTCGHADVGKSTEAVYMRVYEDRIQMPDGRDVFVNASKFMTRNTLEILQKNGMGPGDLTYLIPHQANLRIMNKVGESLGLKNGNIVTNINELGNTGSASSAIALSQCYEKINAGDILVVTVFGGGYSSGSILLKK